MVPTALSDWHFFCAVFHRLQLKSVVLSAQMSKFVEPIIQLFANMKKEENCLRLEEIRTALAKADAERLSSGVSAQERELMEEACVTLREAERRAILYAL